MAITRAKRKRTRLERKHELMGWLFAAPALLLLLFIVGAPTIGTLAISFTNWDGFVTPSFVGIHNFIRLSNDSVFAQALFNNIRWLIFFCTVPIFFALIIAVVLSNIKRGRMIFRTIFFVPFICSAVISSRLWVWIYSPFLGINSVLEELFGLTNLPFWLGDPRIVLYSVMIADSWRYWGFLFVLIFTALQQVDISLSEAAIIDGANRYRLFWHITIPQLRPTLTLVMMLTMMWSFSTFDHVFIMTQGGPGRASELISTYMYKTALFHNMPGYASSIAFVMLFFSVVILIGFGALRKRGWDI